MSLQLDLFEKDTFALVLLEMQRLKKDQDNTRKGLFKRLEEMRKEIDRLKEKK